MIPSRNRSFALQNILLRKALFRSRGTHRARVRKELKARYTPSFLTVFIVKGYPLNNPLCSMENMKGDDFYEICYSSYRRLC